MVINKLMTNTNQAMGVKASAEGIEKVKQRKDELVRPNNPDKIGWTYNDIAEKAFISEATVKRFLQGKAVERSVLVSIAKALELNYEDIIDGISPQEEQLIDIDWLAICEEMLDKQRDANELRRKATGLGAENNVYMPLDLVKTMEKKQEQPAENLVKTIEKKQEQPAESKNKRRKRETEDVTYPHVQFLEDLPNWQRENKHIAIAG